MDAILRINWSPSAEYAGRRGAGKTTLVNATKETENQITIYLNLEDYKDITFPNIIIQIVLELFSTISERIEKQWLWYKLLSRKAHKVNKNIKKLSEALRKYLHEPDVETQAVSEKEGYQEELSAGVKTPTASGGAKTKRNKSRETKREIPKNKIEYLRIELTARKHARRK